MTTALAFRLVDVWFSSLSQVEGDRSGPLGRLLSAKNAVVRQFTPGSSAAGTAVPKRIKIKQRNGYVARTLASRNAADGTAVSSPDWSRPELLTELDDESVSVCNSIPRVWNGSSWTYFSDNRVIPSKLTSSINYTSNHTIQAPSRASTGGVTCRVWTETTISNSNHLTGAWVSVQADDGTWLRTPQVLYQGVDLGDTVLAKVTADPTAGLFWVAVDKVGLGGQKIAIHVYDLHGAELATKDINRNESATPGHWDVEWFMVGGVVLIQPTSGTGTDAGVDLSTLTYASSVITEVRVTDATAHCIGPLTWVTNDLGDGLGYYCTLGAGEAPPVYGYQTHGAAQTHEFVTGVTVNDKKFLASIVGWLEASNTPNQPTLFFGTSYLADGTQTTVGPAFDPAFRRISVYSTTWANSTTPLKQIDSVVPVTRAFKHDDDYYAVTYYQSGSGLSLSPNQQTVAHHSGDYMLGAQSQPVDVQIGDRVEGPAFSLSGNGVQPLSFTGSLLIAAGDKVENYTCAAGDEMNKLGLPVGTALLKWSLANITSGNTTGALEITTSSDAGANGIWQCAEQVPGAGSVVYTFPFNASGQTVNAPITFAAAGHCEFLQMARYYIPDLASRMLAGNVLSNSLTWSGDSVSGNNGSFSIFYAEFDNNADPSTGNWLSPFLKPNVKVINVTSSYSASSAPIATLTPTNPNTWEFSNAAAYVDTASIGSNLVVSDSAPSSGTPPSDLGVFAITGSAFAHGVQTAGSDASAVIAYIWKSAPFPTVSIELPISSSPYTFKFGNVTVDYTYQDATIVVQGAVVPANNTEYQVIGVDPTNNLLFAEPINGSTNQKNQNFTGVETITIVKASSIVAPWQPTWLLTPLTGPQSLVGRFDNLAAYADWFIEGDATLGPNQFPMALATVQGVNGGLQVDLPYRAQNVTSALPIATVRGQVAVAGATILANTVGLKQWSLDARAGVPTAAGNELLIPGPMAAEFTTSGFFEDGIALGFEAPYLVSLSTAAAGLLGLTVGARYQYVVIGECTDLNGNRYFTPPSPPLNVHLTGTNNIATLQGRSMNPLASDGTLIPGDAGVTNRLVAISIYRTVIGQGGTPTVTRFELTNDLAANGLAPVSSLNASGFSFPDEFTWQYVDQNPDVTASAAEAAYVDKGYLPRFPAPAFTFATTWHSRTWVIAADGSLWLSGEKTEGDAIWFNNGLRITLPSDDRPVAMAPLEGSLIVFCAGGSVWQIPAVVLPDATGRNGTLPTPIQLPFNVPCTGYAVAMSSAVAFSSSSRGASVWAINRSLQLVALSQQIQDSLMAVTGLAVDSDQRLHVATGTNSSFVYDEVVDCWTEHVLTTATELVALSGGEASYQDAGGVVVYDPTVFRDIGLSSDSPVALDVELSSINLSSVRALKSVTEFALSGEYKGPHRITIYVSYPDEVGEPTTQCGPYTPDPSNPYVIQFNAMVEDATSYGLRFVVDFVGVETPGDSCELEVVTLEAGFDSKAGAAQLPDSSRAE